MHRIFLFEFIFFHYYYLLSVEFVWLSFFFSVPHRFLLCIKFDVNLHILFSIQWNVVFELFVSFVHRPPAIYGHSIFHGIFFIEYKTICYGTRKMCMDPSGPLRYYLSYRFLFLYFRYFHMHAVVFVGFYSNGENKKNTSNEIALNLWLPHTRRCSLHQKQMMLKKNERKKYELRKRK